MKEIFSGIEAGKQRGASGVFSIEGFDCYCSAGIQKVGSTYKAHVSIIREEDMASENFRVLFTREFTSIENAVECIEKNSPIKVSSFHALKGQRLFNPAFNEENET